MGFKLENIIQRLEKLEQSNRQDALILVELLANINFFGQMKKNLCKYAKNDQCALFVVDSDIESKLPLATSCKIKDCKVKSRHNHIELSCTTCSLCDKAETSINSFEIIDQKIINETKEKQTKKA